MNPFNRFTIKAQEALQRAQDLAVAESHGEFNSLHLLAALFADSESLVRPILSQSGVNLETLNEAITAELKKLPKIFSSTSVGQLYLSQEVIKVIDQAAKSAAANKDEFISCEHLLLGILSVDSAAKMLLEQFGLKKETATRSLAKLRGSSRVMDDMPESKFQAIEKYGINLTEQAREGKLDPVVGREEELRRVIQILSRKAHGFPEHERDISNSL